MLEKVLLSLLAFALFVIAHLAVFRFVKIKVYRFRILELLFGVFAVIYTMLSFTIPSNLISEGIVEINTLGQVVSYATGLLIYILLFFAYLHPYYINERSNSLRICIEIAKSQAGRLTFEEILKEYDHAHFAQNRLDDLIYGGFVARDGNFYRLTKKGTLTAKIFAFSRKFLNCPSGY